MNNKFFSLLAGMAMIVAGLAFTSCSSSDDDDTKPTTGATEAYLTPNVLVAEDMFDYFDVTCAIDGETIVLTKDNTQSVDKTVEKIPFKLRQYTGAKKTYKKFPAEMKIVQTVKVKAGVDLKTISLLEQYVMYTYIQTDNNYTATGYPDGVWTDITGSSFGSLFRYNLQFAQMSDSKLAEYQTKTLTTTFTMSSAMLANLSAVFTPVK